MELKVKDYCASCGHGSELYEPHCVLSQSLFCKESFIFMYMGVLPACAVPAEARRGHW